MERYISKSALVAEIKKLRKNNEPKENMQYAQFELDVACGYDMALDDIEAFIDTLEVKEVDLNSEIKNWLDHGDITDTRYDDYDDGDIERTAKHFFELGLKSKGK